METTEKDIAALLLASGAVKISPEKPFTWASGWSSPIYCDNRLTLSYPATRRKIRDGLAKLVQNHYPEAQAIAGVATAGIPQGAMVADLLELPFLYVRSKPKGHGMENLIEGKTIEGARIVLIEDLISTGGSCLKAAQALQAAGYEVQGVVAVFTYGFPLASANFAAEGVGLHTLSNYSALLEVGLRQNLFQPDELQSLESWRQAPDKWKR